MLIDDDEHIESRRREKKKQILVFDLDNFAHRLNYFSQFTYDAFAIIMQLWNASLSHCMHFYVWFQRGKKAEDGLSLGRQIKVVIIMDERGK